MEYISIKLRDIVDMTLAVIIENVFDLIHFSKFVDKPARIRYPSSRVSGGSGAAETCEPRQVREEATVRRSFRVPPGSLPDIHFSL